MAEQSQQSALGATFPAPPPFWQAFTPENVDRIAQLRAAQAGEAENTSSDTKPIRVLDLPSELRFLQPPEPPADGIWNCFGGRYFLTEPIPTLAEAGVEQLYTPPATPTGKHVDRALILKRLAKSLLLNFLELVGIMSVDPSQNTEKIQDLRTIFINFHHLLNEYRPHQARESLILMMQDQLDRSRAETEGIMRMKEKVEGILEGLGETKLPESDDTKMDGTDAMEEDIGKGIWDELEKEFS
ncbi:hypothetical protein BP6252_06602 [Coleophoma cylindrospora]|uniref:Mediator of RNA polymerase II transcription subunit 7 n=1 Tax=Coleophoma cylindrospora TaxID=1849047 RepID=A0A3D8RND2_9HELO|nr:hypothetical protein BP6252_06602 [Coleophoma cylindrospora]